MPRLARLSIAKPLFWRSRFGRSRFRRSGAVAALLLGAACAAQFPFGPSPEARADAQRPAAEAQPETRGETQAENRAETRTENSAPGRRLAEAAIARVGRTVAYDGRYRRLAYPMGDAPDHLGVCTDLVVRAYRAALGVDLQALVHQDMVRAFDRYPQAWGLTRPDPNIDHRRVLNLERFFTRQGAALPPSADPGAYRPGDLVTYRLPGGRPHIGVVTDRRSAAGRPLIAHNIGSGAQLEDFLFAYPIVGHYRFTPRRPGGTAAQARRP